MPRMSRGGYPAKFAACPAENRPDAIGGNARDLTDFLVTFPFEMVKPDDGGLLSVQHLKEAFSLLSIGDPVFFRPGHRRRDFGRRRWFWTAGTLMSSRKFALLKSTNNHPPGHHTEVTGQAAPTAKFAQNSKIVFKKGKKDL